MNNKFIHLHLHSAYSLAEGAIKIKDLIDLCVEEKMPAIAVTDSNNLFGAMEFSLEATKRGVQPILGCQITVNEKEQQLVLLAQNKNGYNNLCKLSCSAYINENPKQEIYTNYDIFIDITKVLYV